MRSLQAHWALVVALKSKVIARCRDHGVRVTQKEMLADGRVIRPTESMFRQRLALVNDAVDELMASNCPALSLENPSGFRELAANGQLLAMVETERVLRRGRAQRVRGSCSCRMSRPREIHRCPIGTGTLSFMGTWFAASRNAV
jgi:hypothetical protein